MGRDFDKDQRVEDLFADALEQAGADRLTWLERECAGDVEMFAEIRSLLRAFDRAPELIDRSILPGWTESIVDSLPDTMAGRLLGPWRIVELIATGGMAAVYLGERVDDAFRKKVAIKILAGGSFHPGLLSRFRIERQLLADLDHPSIARLLDGGTTPEGVPYLVMEYVEGTSIRDAARSLSVEERLRLFLDVADAVQYAHANLVIHRDLKPGNIVVRPDGHAKLLDFGIAKVFQPGSGDGAAETVAGTAWALTPRYASPEQISGRRVTTATDIYSLGVVLYELLTGRLPYAMDRDSVIEIGRVICETPPVPPSRLRDLPEARRLAGDLETILLKALAKEPDRRYRSVADFAEDVRRHLHGETVLARGDSAGYRVAQFVRRHRMLVAGVISVITMLVVALAVTLFYYRRAVASADEARWSSYTSVVAAAESAIMNHSTPEARVLLDQTEESFRGWEYRHLRARLDRSVSSWTAHTAPVTGLTISPDGTRLLTVSPDSTARVWTTDGDSLMAWLFPGEVVSCRFLSGTDRIVVGVDRGQVMTASIGGPPELLGRGSYWAIVDVDPGGRMVAAGFENGEVALFDADSRRELRRWKAHHRLAVPAFSPDGTELATAGSDSVVHVWSLQDGGLKATLRGHRRRIYSLAYSWDGRRLVTGSSDGTATVWSLDTGQAVTSFSEHRGVPSKLAFHPDGRSILSAGTEGRLLVWDAITGGRKGEFHGHCSDVTTLVISSDGGSVVTGEADGTVRKWRWGTDDVRVLRGLSAGSQTADIFPLTDFDMDPEGRIMVTFNGRTFPEGRALMVREAFGGERLRYGFPFLSALTLIDSTAAVIGTERGEIIVFSFAGGESQWTLRTTVEATGPVTALAFHPTRSLVACAEGDGVISLRTLPDLTAIRTWKGHATPVTSLEFNTPGTLLASADGAGGVRLWNPATGDSLAGLPPPGSGITDMAFHPAHRVLAITTVGGTALLWPFERAGARCDTLMAAQRGAACVTFDREGRRLVVGNQDGMISLVDFERRTPIVRLHGHLSKVSAVRFTEDGNTLVSSSFDGTLRVWDTGSVGPNR